jgi:hypothetical protein
MFQHWKSIYSSLFQVEVLWPREKKSTFRLGNLLNGDLAAGTSVGLDGLLDVLQFNNDAAATIDLKLNSRDLMKVAA